MISREIELNSLLKSVMDYLYNFENLQMNFLMNFFQYVEEKPIEISNLDYFDIINIIKEKYFFDNVNELIFASYLKTIIENNHYESVPNFIAKILLQNESLAEDFENSIIFLSQQIPYTKTLILFKIVKNFNFNYKEEEFVHPLLYWFLVGELFSASNGFYNRPIFLLSEIDIYITDIYEIITNVMDARKHYEFLDLDSLARIYGNSIRGLGYELGFESTIDAFIRQYQNESNKTIRYAFHKSYINVLNDNPGWGDWILSATSSFVRVEQDLTVLMNILLELKKIFSWNTISYVACAVLDHEEIQNYPDFYENIYSPYKHDIVLDNSIIFASFDIFLRLWKIVTSSYKHEMFLLFKEWIENSLRPSITIKKVLLESLISNTSEMHWLHLLYQAHQILGPSRVTILGEVKSKARLNILPYKENKNHNDFEYSNLASNTEGLFCLGCRIKLANNHSVLQNQCGNCLAIFCNNCYEIWLDHINKYGEQFSYHNQQQDTLTCLGSSLYGFNHEFVTTN